MSAHIPFTEHLIAWQKAAGRHDLPWQRTRDAYRIWLSEIMLQQTQVSTVIPYYLRFLEDFPDVRALAAAPIEAVIAHWAGLGYYARARNLHRCAQVITANYAGEFPDSVEALAALPGIGKSTAAAIAAFAFGHRAAILDGNVKRVLCRHFAVSGFPGQAQVHRQLWRLAESLLPDSDIEAYTQGLMDLGATCCTRSRPQCGRCPLAGTCIALHDGRQGLLPETRPRPALPERESTFAILVCDARVLLERRPSHGLWGGLLVPPEEPADLLAQRLGVPLDVVTRLPDFRHSFTHFRLQLHPELALLHQMPTTIRPPLHWVPLHQATESGVPAPIRKLLVQVSQLVL